MKTIVTALSALLLLGAVSTASASAGKAEFGSLAWWQQMADQG